MAKLVLVNAGKNYEYGTHEPLHLLVLAAYVKDKGHEVAIADQIAGEDIFTKIRRLNPDFVGITATTAVIGDAYEVADWCKENGFKSIMGGVHPTIMPEETLKHADFVVKGEGEEALVKILEGKNESETHCTTIIYIDYKGDMPKFIKPRVLVKQGEKIFQLDKYLDKK